MPPRTKRQTVETSAPTVGHNSDVTDNDLIAENHKITDIFCANLRYFLDGRPGAMRNVLDKALLY